MFYTDMFVSKQNLFWFMKVWCGHLDYDLWIWKFFAFLSAKANKEKESLFKYYEHTCILYKEHSCLALWSIPDLFGLYISLDSKIMCSSQYCTMSAISIAELQCRNVKQV